MKASIVLIATAALLTAGATAQTDQSSGAPAAAKNVARADGRKDVPNYRVELELDVPTTRPASESGSMGYDVRIELALFGSGTHLADVTDRVIELLRSEPQAISANTIVNANAVAGFTATAANLHIDPTPGKNKSLLIRYRYHDHERLFMVTGGQRASYAALVVEDDANN